MAETKSKIRRMSWFMALFKETNTYSVVPKNWILTSKNNNDNVFVKWPPLQNVTSDIICAAMDPLQTWKAFKVKLLDDGKEYSDKIYEKIILQDLNITINTSKIKDKYVMLKNKNIVILKCIVKRLNESEFKIIVQTFLNCINFYSSPILSSNLGTFIVNTALLSDEFVISVTDIKYKCFFVPISNEKAIVTTLCHSISE